MADSLRDELLSIPGIEEAEFEGEGPTPAGVRVRLSADADTDVVGEEVRRVLATHGMRSQVSAAGEPPIPPPPPGAPASVVTLPGVSIAPAPPDVPELPSQPAPEPQETERDAVPAPVVSTSAKLQSVAVEEGREGVVVRVTAAGGATAERRARPGGAGLDAAVVSAVGQLLAPTAAPPLVVEVLDHEISGTSVVTVVLELGDGSRRVGSAVSDGGRVYAVGYATWQALSDG